MFLDGGREEAPQLPKDDRQRKREADGEAHLHRSEKGFRNAKRDRLLVLVRQRPVEPVDQPVVEYERDREADHERAEGDEDARAQFVEVLDERRLLAVAKAPR